MTQLPLIQIKIHGLVIYPPAGEELHLHPVSWLNKQLFRGSHWVLADTLVKQIHAKWSFSIEPVFFYSKWHHKFKSYFSCLNANHKNGQMALVKWHFHLQLLLLFFFLLVKLNFDDTFCVSLCVKQDHSDCNSVLASASKMSVRREKKYYSLNNTWQKIIDELVDSRKRVTFNDKERLF